MCIARNTYNIKFTDATFTETPSMDERNNREFSGNMAALL
jgi:hypothetical protein